MKIIYIINSRMPTEKAHGFQVMKMCEAFSNAGVEIEVLIPRRFNLIGEDPFVYYGVRRSFVIKKIPVLDLLPLEKIFGFFAGWVESFTFAVSILFYLQKRNGQVLIYSRDQFILWFLSFSNRKFIYEMHSFPKSAFWYKRIWQKSAKIIVITQGLKNLLTGAEIASEKIMTAPDGVDLGSFFAVNQSKEDLKIDLGFSLRDFLVGYIGRFKTLEMEKGIKTMIAALPLLDEEVKMVFVGGEESEIKEYKSLANRFNVAARCIFAAYQPYARVVKYAKAMDALVIPFPNLPHYAHYASPLKLFEYMAAGAPIIASNLPSLREVLNEKNALFFSPENSEDLAKAVKMLKSSQMLGYHLSRQALADVVKYSWANRAENIMNFLK